MVKNYIFFEKLSVNALISTVGIRIPTKNFLKKILVVQILFYFYLTYAHTAKIFFPPENQLKYYLHPLHWKLLLMDPFIRFTNSHCQLLQ